MNAAEKALQHFLEAERARAADVDRLYRALAADAAPEPPCPVTGSELYAFLRGARAWVRTESLPGADVAPQAVLRLLDRLMGDGWIIRMSSASGDSWRPDRNRTAP